MDISKLVNVGDHITFADMNFDRETIELLEPAKEIVCKVDSKRTNIVESSVPEEAPAADAKPDAAKAD